MSDFDPEEMLLLRDAARRNSEGMERSHIFLQLFTPGIRADPIALMQIGLAVVLDKPILLLVQEGIEIPDNVRRLARYLEEVDFRKDRDYETATRRLMAFAVEEGLIPES